MGLYDSADKAAKDNPVTFIGSDGVPTVGYCKMTPMKLEVARKTAKYNRLGTLPRDHKRQAGDWVQIDEDWYIVGNISPDMYRGQVIRYNSELMYVTDVVTVYRPTVTKDATHGGVTGQTLLPVEVDAKVLITTSDMFVEGPREEDVGDWFLYWSIHLPPLRPKDRLEYRGKALEVKFERYDTLGVVMYRLKEANV